MFHLFLILINYPHTFLFLEPLYGLKSEAKQIAELKPGEYLPKIPYYWNTPEKIGKIYKTLKIVDLFTKKHNIPY